MDAVEDWPGCRPDFNNLLTVIGGYSQHLLDSTSPEDPKRTALEQILKASNRAAALTSQLLAFGRKQVLRPQLINLNHLLTNMESLLRRSWASTSPFMPYSARLCFSSKPIQSTGAGVINLAANARDAMPDGGEFRIETALIDASEGGAEGRLKEGRYARLKVSDTGIGMNTKVLEHLFEPFFTTKAVGKGSGLGLSTVYGIVQQNQGTIHVTSERGRGTAFEIYLPAVPAGEEVKEPAAAVSGRLNGHETILLAEDEPAVRKLVRDALEQLGYTVLTAADGYEAMRILEVHTAPCTCY
jgi:signal transduction histidine kinase